MVGTTIEFYDFYIYATAAVSVFPSLFFPPKGEFDHGAAGVVGHLRPGVRGPAGGLSAVRLLR